jgi:uncharacterized protein YndB with AHSA1/START domain
MDAGTDVSVVDDGPLLRAVVRGLGCPPETALAAFTDADVAARWWGGGRLTADLVPGGRYTVWFEAIGEEMAGQVVGYQPGRSLEFSWAWTHTPDDPPRTVIVTVAGEPDGSVLTVVHGPHGDGERERVAREEHREGWEFFLPRLARVVSEGRQPPSAP